MHHRHWIPLGTMHKEVLHLPEGHGWSPPAALLDPQSFHMEPWKQWLFPSLKSRFSAHIHYHPPRSCGQMASFAAAAADTRPGGVKPEVAITGNLFVSSSFLLRGTCDLERTQAAASPKSCWWFSMSFGDALGLACALQLTPNLTIHCLGRSGRLAKTK